MTGLVESCQQTGLSYVQKHTQHIPNCAVSVMSPGSTISRHLFTCCTTISIKHHAFSGSCICRASLVCPQWFVSSIPTRSIDTTCCTMILCYMSYRHLQSMLPDIIYLQQRPKKRQTSELSHQCIICDIQFRPPHMFDTVLTCAGTAGLHHAYHTVYIFDSRSRHNVSMQYGKH